jgi:hypothetical protein
MLRPPPSHETGEIADLTALGALALGLVHQVIAFTADAKNIPNVAETTTTQRKTTTVPKIRRALCLIMRCTSSPAE